MELTEKRWIPDGFHFIGPEEAKKRIEIVKRIFQILEDHKFQEVLLPSFDYTSSILNNVPTGEKINLFKTVDNRGFEISPSFDCTIQAVKGIALLNKDQIHKIFYKAKIIRDTNRLTGSKKEIEQIGVEIIGDSKIQPLELLFELIHLIFKNLLFKEKPVLVLGNQKIFDEIIRVVSSKTNSNTSDLKKIIEEKNISLLQESFRNLDNSIFELIKNLMLLKDQVSFSALIKNSLFIDNKLINEEKSKFDKILEKINSNDYDFKLEIDPTLTSSKIKYYTGFIFKVYIHSLPETILDGGVYDKLYEQFSEISKDACGFGLNLDLINELLLKNKEVTS